MAFIFTHYIIVSNKKLFIDEHVCFISFNLHTYELLRVHKLIVINIQKIINMLLYKATINHIPTFIIDLVFLDINNKVTK